MTTVQTAQAEPRVAEHGEKMIEITVRLWTNNIAPQPGEIIPKQAWSAGKVYLTANTAHGIESRSPVDFHSMAEIGTVIEELCIEHGIKLHLSKKARKYMVAGA